MGDYTYTFGSPANVDNGDGTTTQYTRGDTYHSTSACDMLNFMSRVRASRPETTNVGAEDDSMATLQAEAEAEGCLNPAATDPVQTNDGTPTANPPAEGDNSETLGAPRTEQPSNQVGQQRPPGYDPNAQPPTDAVHDPNQPAQPGEVIDGMIGDGASPDDAQTTVERAERGENQPGEPRSTHTGERAHANTEDGDPVQLFSGRFHMHSVDLALTSPFFEMQFVRRYLSGRPYYGPLGYNWDHNWNIYLRELNDGSVARWSGELHEDTFTPDGAGFASPAGIFEQLIRLPGLDHQYRITTQNGTQLTFIRPGGWTDAERIPLQQITDVHGNSIALSYDHSNRLLKVEDDDGRFFALRYGDCGFLEQLEDHNGRRVHYFHDQMAEHLIAVRLAHLVDQDEVFSSQYEYALTAYHPALRHNITHVTDALNHSVLVNEYGMDPGSRSFNRVVQQYIGGSRYQFSYHQLQWVPANENFVDITAEQTTVQHPNGAIWVYSFNYRGDLLDERFRNTLDGSYRISATARRFDAQGNLVRIALPDGTMREWIYDHNSPDPRRRGNLLRVELRSGGLAPLPSRIISRVQYDPTHNLMRTVISENNQQTRFLYDYDITPGAIDNRGLLREVHWPDATLPDGTVQSSITRLEWNARGQKIAMVSPTGVRQEWHYIGAGANAGLTERVIQDALTEALTTEYEYSPLGFLWKEHKPGGHVYEREYDVLGQLLTFRLPEINGKQDETRYQYDVNTRLVNIDRPKGDYSDAVIADDFIRDHYVFNEAGFLEKLIIGENSESPREWRVCSDFAGRPIEIEDPQGHLVQRCWNERGDLLVEKLGAESEDPLVHRYVYDTVGRIVREEKPGEQVTEQLFDPWGRVVEVHYPNGSVGKNDWGIFDLLMSQELIGEPSAGALARTLRKSEYDYDERGRLTHYSELVFTDDVATAQRLTTEKYYDEDGRVTRRVAPQGHEFFVNHDGLGRIIQTQDPLGNQKLWDYGIDGLPMRFTEIDTSPSGDHTKTTEFVHDARGRLIGTSHNLLSAYQTQFDGRDLPVSSVDANGIVTEREFGLLGEVLTQRFDPAGLGIEYRHHYDALGREIAFIDPLGHVTKVERDSFGRVVKTLLADGSEHVRVFNNTGMLQEEQSPAGYTTEFQYDSAQRLSGFSVAGPVGRDPVVQHQLSYDGANRLVEASHTSTAVRQYDSLDRLIHDSVSGAGIERRYDDLNSEFFVSFSDGREERHEFDELGRVNHIEISKLGASPIGNLNGAVGDLIAQIHYRGAIRVAELNFGNGLTEHWRHDEEGRLIGIDVADDGGNAQQILRYLHDHYNRRTAKQFQQPPAQTHAYQYDSRGRLISDEFEFEHAPLPLAVSQASQDSETSVVQTSAAGAAARHLFTVNASDAREQKDVHDGMGHTVETLTYNHGYQLTNKDGSPLLYDSDGLRIEDSDHQYFYDALGRISRIENAVGDVLQSFEYDPFGRWIGGTKAGQNYTRTLLDFDCYEETEADILVRQQTLLTGAITPLVSATDHGRLYRHHDASHSLIGVSNQSGSLQEQFRYDAFGQSSVFDAAASPIGQSALGMSPMFSGMTQLSSGSLYFTPARIYDAANGLFLARDPLLHLQSPNPYVFALHDPVNLLDPDGNLPPLIIAGLIIGGIGAAIGAGSVMLTSDDWDAWDVVAGATIGFGAGFIGAVTFGWASGAIGGGLLTTAGGAAAVEGTAAAGAISVASGIGGGALSGLASGLFSGGANGVYHGGIRGRGDMWQMIGDGMYREGISGMAAGAVTGGLFQGSLMAGRPGVTWTALRSQFAGGQPARVIGRGLLSPYGLGGAGIGFAGGMTGGTTRRMLEGQDVGDAFVDSLSEGALGAGAGGLMTAFHPSTVSYWRPRLSPAAAAAIESTRPGGIHHQRNVAQYPEYAVRRDQPRAPHDFFDRMNNAVTRGNIEGPQSTYNAPNNPITHRQMHEQWRFGQTFRPNSWTNVPTHGPWTPPWAVGNWPNSIGTNHGEKEQ